MTAAAAPQPPLRALPRIALLAVALISAALIAYEIVLMRRLLIERWHHFGYLVISAALLGFGASGTLLAIIQRTVRRRPVETLWLTALLLAASLTLMPRLAACLPVAARFIPDDLWRQVGWWSLYWLAAGIPFLIGAAHIGAAIMLAGRGVGAVYGINLLGSAAGALAGGLLVSRWPIESAFLPANAAAWAATIALSLLAVAKTARLPRIARSAATLVLCAGAIVLESTRPSELAADEFKDRASIQRLVAQGSARLVARAADPHGCVEIYESPTFHSIPFLFVDAPTPPPMLQVLVNGDAAGSVLRVAGVEQAGVVEKTLMATAYRLAPPNPRVLLLGEAGGANVWLARRRAASSITVVQPNAALIDLLRGPLAETSGHVFDGDKTFVIAHDLRGFFRRAKLRPFDLIQIVALEGLGVGASGLGGLAEDHLLTVEGLADCLRKLSPPGVLSICRGIQSPERVNIRLLATLVESLESIGVDDASSHIVQVRDILGVCTMAFRSPIDLRRRDALVAVLDEFNLTPVWYDGLPPERINRPDVMDGPPGTHVDWLHHAAAEIFSPRRDEFLRDWAFNVRPPRDDSPFFWDFYKPGATAVLRQWYGDLWLTRAELGRLFLYASLLISCAAAVVLIFAPLAIAAVWERAAIRRTSARSSPVLWMVVYFGSIGLGFMGVEMALISRAIRVLGDPVIASAAVIGAVLVLSGLGSLTGRRVLGSSTRRAAAPAAALAMVVALLSWAAQGAQFGAGIVVLFAFSGALAYFMGMPMPAGIAALTTRAPRLVPWAWGVNGVASVIGTSLAIVIAMSSGYRYVFVAAAGLYVLAALAAIPLADRRAGGDNQRSLAGGRARPEPAENVK